MWQTKQTNYLPSYMDGCKLPTLHGQLGFFFFMNEICQKKKLKIKNFRFLQMCGLKYEKMTKDLYLIYGLYNKI
jgi:hypothetical protein